MVNSPDYVEIILATFSGGLLDWGYRGYRSSTCIYSRYHIHTYGRLACIYTYTCTYI